MLKNWGKILDASHRNNAVNNITGFLIFDKRVFVQVLEGERQCVGDTYECIKLDSRHHSPQVINVSEEKVRAFEGWDMGSAILSPAMESIFRASGIKGRLNPAILTGAKMIQLSRDLKAYTMAKTLKSA